MKTSLIKTGISICKSYTQDKIKVFVKETFKEVYKTLDDSFSSVSVSCNDFDQSMNINLIRKNPNEQKGDI
jgi:hypothetical protein